ncbi:hypothetical protein COOONC_14790, partial [Cooperia oncophora]
MNESRRRLHRFSTASKILLNLWMLNRPVDWTARGHQETALLNGSTRCDHRCKRQLHVSRAMHPRWSHHRFRQPV